MEEWKDVVGYEGLYQVSNLGEVKSLERFNPNSGKHGMLYKERLLAQKTDKDGYKIVRLCQLGKMKDWKVHRLVMFAFSPIDNPQAYEVNHIDGNKCNNCLDNLEWSTTQENSWHRSNVLGSKANVKIILEDITTGEQLEFISKSQACRSLDIPYSTLNYQLKNNKIIKNKYKKVLTD